MTPCCRSMVSVSQPWWAITSAEKPLGMASQPLTAAWSLRHSVRRRFSLMSGLSSDERGALGIEGPSGQKVLHRDAVVACAQAVLAVQAMRLVDLGHVQLDAEARLLRHVDESAADLQRLLRQPLSV